MSKIVKIAIGVAVVAAVVVGGVKAVKNAKAKDANTPKAKIYPVVVSTIMPQQSHVILTLPYLAVVANDKDVKLASKIAARVEYVKPSGSKVKQGEVIVKLDKTSISSSLASVSEQLEAAKITLANLEATHKRTLELLKVDGASIEQSEKESSAIASAKANINALEQKQVDLQNTLSYTTILSPVDGVIAQTFVNKGDLSAPAKPLVAISAKNGFYLMVRTPSDMSVRGVRFNQKTYQAMALGSTLNGLSEYKVYVDNAKLTSGERVEVDVVVYDAKGVVIPFDALLNKNGKSYVFIANKDHAQAQEVHVVQSGEQGVVVREDLSAKQVIVAKPDILLKLMSGYALSVKE